MAKPRKTPDDVCIEYAIAIAEERRLTRVMQNTHCMVVDAAMVAFGQMIEQNPAMDLPSQMPSDETCLTKHWQIETYAAAGEYVERPVMSYEEMCAACKDRLQAFEDRREVRKRLGSAKRSVESCGKRLNAEVVVV